MRILFVHQYFPGQFQRIANHYLLSGEHEIVAFHRGHLDGRSMPLIAGIQTLQYGQEVDYEKDKDHPLYDTELFIRESASMALRAEEMKRAGWIPDLIYSHTGWGTGAFLHDVFPSAKFVKYCEWFYNNAHIPADSRSSAALFASRLSTSLLNIPVLTDLVRADLLISPTEFQRSRFPTALKQAIQVVPDGVDTELCCPDPGASFTVGSGRVFRPGDRVITYVARGADPFRGFKQFIDALGLIQARDPNVEAIVVGDRTSYYDGPNGSEAYFNKVVSNATFDPARTHFTGRLSHESYRNVLKVSAAHVYLTVPFVLSWSAFEAMATGCAFVGSDTPPVREFVRSGENGLLADMNNAEQLAAATLTMLDGGRQVADMRSRARQTIIDRWSAEIAVERHTRLVREMMG